VANVCECCGSNVYFAREFPRLRGENEALRHELERIHARMGVVEARQRIAEIEAKEKQRAEQSKAERQRRVIVRLEKKLRALGEGKPYGDGSESR